MTRVLALVACLSCFVVSVCAFAPAAATAASVTPSAPTELNQFMMGLWVPAGGWSRSPDLTIHVHAQGTGGWLHAQLQVGLAGSSIFTPVATGRGQAALIPAGSTRVLSANVSGLKDGEAYVWQVRVVDESGAASAWVPFTTGGTVAFRTDLTPPSAPTITSTSGLKPGKWSNAKSAAFSWSSKDGGSGIAGYAYSFGHTPKGAHHDYVQATTASMKSVPNGKWVLRVWARDKAGNWSKVSDFGFNVDRTPPKLAVTAVSNSLYNPFFGSETWTFTLSKTANVVLHVDSTKHWVVMTKDLGVLKAGTRTFIWNGKGAKGHLVPNGLYWIQLKAADNLGNYSGLDSMGIHVNLYKPTLPYYPEPGRHIVVSLSKEAVYAYDGEHLVKWSLATTGNPDLPTPTGHFEIFARFSPFTFISPWPEGSPYYYPPSPVNYAMEFQSAGYFIHDAPWRTVYGPGSNGPGQPGTNYGGSHGCVNVPLSMALFLWNWSTIGTPIDIIN